MSLVIPNNAGPLVAGGGGNAAHGAGGNAASGAGGNAASGAEGDAPPHVAGGWSDDGYGGWDGHIGDIGAASPGHGGRGGGVAEYPVSRAETSRLRKYLTPKACSGERVLPTKYGGQQQQRGDGGQRYQQQPRPQQRPRPQQQQDAWTGWVGNTGRGWYQPESLPPPGASMGTVYKCERCGALGHTDAICRAPNAFGGACNACGVYGHMARQCSTAPPTRIQVNTLFDGAMLGGGVGVPHPKAWLQQGGQLVHDDIMVGSRAGPQEKRLAEVQQQRQYGVRRQQQEGEGGGQRFQQQPRPQQQQQHHTGTGWAGNTGRGWHQPESPPPPGASRGRVYKCEQCGALGHKAAICRAPNAFAGACSICGAYGHLARQCSIAPPTRMHANVATAMPSPFLHGPTGALQGSVPMAYQPTATTTMSGGGVDVPQRGVWLQQQGDLVMHGDGSDEWDGGGERGGV